jgi:hypothetical protein
MGRSLMVVGRLHALYPSHWPRGTIKRAVLAGGGWGIVMGLGLPALAFLDCGTICLSDIALTTAMAVPAGIVAIGPVAALGRAEGAHVTR